jgi:hypothetical protein
MTGKFEIVFEGGLEAGFSQADVRRNLAALFKATTDQVDRMFSGQPVVLRNRLDLETARKYEVVLKKNGALVVVRESGVVSAPTAVATPRLKLAGEKVEQILAKVDWQLAPVGSRLSAEEDINRNFGLSFELDWDLAPVGSDLGQLRATVKPVNPDISHLELVPESD